MTQAGSGNFESLIVQANTHHRAGQIALAYAAYRQCCDIQPGNAHLLATTGSLAVRSGHGDEGIALLERASAIIPANTDFLHDLCIAYRRAGRFDKAHIVIDRAIQLNPAKANFSAMKSELYQMTDELDRAWTALEPVVASAESVSAVAIQFLRLAGKHNRREQAIAAGRKILTLPTLSQFGRINILFGIAALLDELKLYEESFKTYEQGNRAAGVDWNASQHSVLVDSLISSWTPDVVRTLPQGDPLTRRPIFILGMPRSGTTLVEQMLSNLPGVYGAGELNDISFIARQLEPREFSSMPFLSRPDPLRTADVKGLAQRYLNRINQFSADAIRISDKLPTSFLNIGLIRALYPQAAIIHCRRDAMDTCVSCYTQHFDGALSFAYNLSDLGRFYRDYSRLMDHWKSLFGDSIHDVVYEQLVADPESHARRLVEAVGLPWSDAALKFHENTRVARTASIDQVRQRVYTSSVGKYKRFDPWLGPLRDALGPHAAPTAR